MNRLALVKRFNQESAMTGLTISTTIGQSDSIARMVDWVDLAYQDVQGLHVDWDFLRHDFSFQTGTTSREYTKSSAGLPELAAWKVDDIRVYKTITDESHLIFTSWENFRRTFLFGAYRGTTGRPLYFSIDQANSFWTDAIPNDAYTINGEYFKRPQVMTLDTSEPLIPLQHRMVIVWRALMLYGAYEGADDVYSHGEKEYRRVLSQMESLYLPQRSFLKGPLV